MQQSIILTQNKQEYSIRQYLKSIQTLIINALRVKHEFKEEYAQYAIINSSEQISQLLHALILPLFQNDNSSSKTLMRTMQNPSAAGVGFQNLAVFFKNQNHVNLKHIFNPAGKQYQNINEGWSQDEQEEESSEEVKQQTINEQKIMSMIDIESFQSHKKLAEKENELVKLKQQVMNLEDSVVSLNNKLYESELISKQLQSLKSSLESEIYKTKQNSNKLEEQNINLNQKLMDFEHDKKNFISIEIHKSVVKNLEREITKLEQHIQEKENFLQQSQKNKLLILQEAIHLKQEVRTLQDQILQLKKQENINNLPQEDKIDQKTKILYQIESCQDIDIYKELINNQESIQVLKTENSQLFQADQIVQENFQIMDNINQASFLKFKRQISDIKQENENNDLVTVSGLNYSQNVLKQYFKENIILNKGMNRTQDLSKSKSPETLTQSVTTIQQEISSKHKYRKGFGSPAQTYYSKSKKFNIRRNAQTVIKNQINIFNSSQNLLCDEKEIQTDISFHPSHILTRDQLFESFRVKDVDVQNLDNFQKSIGKNKFIFGNEQIHHISSRKNSRFFGKPQQYNLGEVLTKLNISHLKKPSDRNQSLYLHIDSSYFKKFKTPDIKGSSCKPSLVNSPQKTNSIQKIEQRRLGNKYILVKNNTDNTLIEKQ